MAVAVPGLVRGRSVVLLVLLSAVIGLAVASGLATAIWYLVRAVAHAGSGS